MNKNIPKATMSSHNINKRAGALLHSLLHSQTLGVNTAAHYPRLNLALCNTLHEMLDMLIFTSQRLNARFFLEGGVR